VRVTASVVYQTLQPLHRTRHERSTSLKVRGLQGRDKCRGGNITGGAWIAKSKSDIDRFTMVLRIPRSQRTIELSITLSADTSSCIPCVACFRALTFASSSEMSLHRRFQNGVGSGWGLDGRSLASAHHRRTYHCHFRVRPSCPRQQPPPLACGQQWLR